MAHVPKPKASVLQAASSQFDAHILTAIPFRHIDRLLAFLRLSSLRGVSHISLLHPLRASSRFAPACAAASRVEFSVRIASAAL